MDDTLITTDSKIYVTHSDGKKSVLTPGQYAVYNDKPGDVFDFSDFEKLVNPKLISWTFDIFRKVASTKGPDRKTAILTARGHPGPIKKFFGDMGFKDIEVIALSSSNPADKAKWIESQIVNGFDDILFLDDSIKNVNAVKELKKKYPHVKLNVTHVKGGH